MGDTPPVPPPVPPPRLSKTNYYTDPFDPMATSKIEKHMFRSDEHEHQYESIKSLQPQSTTATLQRAATSQSAATSQRSSTSQSATSNTRNGSVKSRIPTLQSIIDGRDVFTSKKDIIQILNGIDVTDDVKKILIMLVSNTDFLSEQSTGIDHHEILLNRMTAVEKKLDAVEKKLDMVHSTTIGIGSQSVSNFTQLGENIETIKKNNNTALRENSELHQKANQNLNTKIVSLNSMFIEKSEKLVEATNKIKSLEEEVKKLKVFVEVASESLKIMQTDARSNGSSSNNLSKESTSKLRTSHATNEHKTKSTSELGVIHATNAPKIKSTSELGVIHATNAPKIKSTSELKGNHNEHSTPKKDHSSPTHRHSAYKRTEDWVSTHGVNPRYDGAFKATEYLTKQINELSYHKPLYSTDGSCTMFIENYRQKRTDAINKKNKTLYSDPFYSSQKGYKMCMSVCPNGNLFAEGEFLSVFFMILKGEYDNDLSWPFKMKIKVDLMDSDGRIFISDSFMPDNSCAFTKPTSEKNEARGMPYFVQQTDVDKLLTRTNNIICIILTVIDTSKL